MPQHRKLALVTGGSAGIGYALAGNCARNGYDVIITGASARVQESATKLAVATGVDVTPVQSDLSTKEGVDKVWRAVVDTGRPLDVAMLNAGVGVGGAGFADTDLEEEVRSIELNVVSQVRLAKPVVQHMLANHSGRILFTTSVSATVPTPYESVYGPTRAFVYSFAQTIREELRGTGVTVTALLPGATATEFHHRAGMGDTHFGDNSWKNDPELVARRGFEAMMAGRDHTVGGDLGTRRFAFLNRFLSEPYKAARHAKGARPAAAPTHAK